MLYVIRAVPEREHLHGYLRERLPDAEWVMEDQEERSAASFTRSLARAFRVQGARGAVHLEDDLILTRDFDAKVRAAVGPYWTEIVQLYSMRKRHRESRWESALTFVHGPAMYVPGSLAPDLAADTERVVEAGKGGSRSYDGGRRVDQGFNTATFLRARGKRYRVHSPSLVQHRCEPSTLHHATRLSGNAGSGLWQSPTFTDPWDEEETYASSEA